MDQATEPAIHTPVAWRYRLRAGGPWKVTIDAAWAKRMRSSFETIALYDGYAVGLEAAAQWHERQSAGFGEQAAADEAAYRATVDGAAPHVKKAAELHLGRWCSSQASQANHLDYASALRALATAPRKNTE